MCRTGAWHLLRIIVPVISHRDNVIRGSIKHPCHCFGRHILILRPSLVILVSRPNDHSGSRCYGKWLDGWCPGYKQPRYHQLLASPEVGGGGRTGPEEGLHPPLPWSRHEALKCGGRIIELWQKEVVGVMEHWVKYHRLLLSITTRMDGHWKMANRNTITMMYCG